MKVSDEKKLMEEQIMEELNYNEVTLRVQYDEK